MPRIRWRPNNPNAQVISKQMKTSDYSCVRQHGANAGWLGQDSDTKRFVAAGSGTYSRWNTWFTAVTRVHSGAKPHHGGVRGAYKRHFSGLHQGGSAPRQYPRLHHTVDDSDDRLH